MGVDYEGPFVGVEAPFFEDGGFDGFFAEADLFGVLVEVDVDVVGGVAVDGSEFGEDFGLGAAEGVGAEAG